MPLPLDRRAAVACLTLFAYLASLTVPARALPVAQEDEIGILSPASLRANCAVDHTRALDVAQATAQTTESPSPAASPSGSPSADQSASPSPQPKATALNVPQGPQTLTLPTIAPTGPVATIPPLPTPTPTPTGTKAPALLQRSSPNPEQTIIPKGSPTPVPSPVPSGVPTLKPGEVAVIADRVSGVYQKKEPSDFDGNVHVFFSDEIAIGDHAHYDGDHTITLTGHPYIINQAGDTILRGDEINVNTDTSVATLTNGRGETTEGVDVGKLHYIAEKLQSDKAGKAHGDRANISTCENPRGGYHITGRTVDVTPGDKMVIRKAVLFLGALAVFYLPVLVIPLRQRPENQGNNRVLPELGYNQFEGYYAKGRFGFGKDQYYYGYYRVEERTKLGLGLGYVGNFAKRNGRRSDTINFYESKTSQGGPTNYNLQANDNERFSQSLNGSLGFTYTGNYGPGIALPPQESYAASLQHTRPTNSQTYIFNRTSQGQTSQDSAGFTDQHRFGRLGQNIQLSFTDNHTPTTTTNAAGVMTSSAIVNTNLRLQTDTTYATPSTDFDLLIDKTDASSATTLSKLPELTIRPHPTTRSKIPITAQLQLGLYNDPTANLTTSRGQASLNIGQGATFNFFHSTLTGNLQILQDAYGTGDLKAQINQTLNLSTPIGKHFYNTINYTESNANGPSAIPFKLLDIIPSTSSGSAQEALHFFNTGIFDLVLQTGAVFHPAPALGPFSQPISYNLTMRPSPRSFLTLGGSFSHAFQQGAFSPTNFQILTPFGKDTDLQMTGDIDWHNHSRLENKVIYLSHIVGQCYEIRLNYNQQLKSVNIAVDILAFPSRAVNYNITKNAPIIPATFNF